ncbi:MAG TPA: aminotransferase class V-fold PLP-dependent enzyme, partial [Bryobacteraceae bacterium]|nr:aminotransferase class V-fold PLP-dependent enzyme [Bryobacteraceae bacterium]
KELLGYPAEAAGLFVSGGSMANLAGLAAARSARAPETGEQGMGGQRLRIYASEEGHFSIRGAAGLLGLGRENVCAIRTDARFRMDAAELERQVEADAAAGYRPMCIVGSLGTTSTGAVDPLEEVAAVARRHGCWLHVDGAYGAFAALAPSGKALCRGLGQADSVALDPHKWLYSSMGCGCVLYRDEAAARAAFAHDAEYIRPVGLERDEAFAFWDFGPELSRPFRALSVWLQIRCAGATALGAAIEQNIQCAKYFERLIQESGDFEMLAPVELSVFCFRYAPRTFAGDLDAFNELLLVELQRAGHSYLSNARLRGRFALRGCVLNYRTTERDMEILLEDVRAAAGQVLASAIR